MPRHKEEIYFIHGKVGSNIRPQPANPSTLGKRFTGGRFISPHTVNKASHKIPVVMLYEDMQAISGHEQKQQGRYEKDKEIFTTYKRIIHIYIKKECFSEIIPR